LEKTIKVGGIIQLTLDGRPPRQATGKMTILNELIGYLYCFLGGSVYPGNKPQTTKTLAKMLVNAQLYDNHNNLCFSFPKKIRQKFDLNQCYSISLIKGDVFGFYCKDLLPKAKLSCMIKIDAFGKEQKYAFRRIQRIIVNSEHFLKSVTIQRIDDGFITTIKSRMEGIDDITIESQKDLLSAIYELQKILIPLTKEEKKRKQEREEALKKLHPQKN
jgi:hypothetical protein